MLINTITGLFVILLLFAAIGNIPKITKNFNLFFTIEVIGYIILGGLSAYAVFRRLPNYEVQLGFVALEAVCLGASFIKGFKTSNKKVR